VANFDRFARQADDSLNGNLFVRAGRLEGDYFPASGAAKLKCRTIEEQAIAIEIDSRLKIVACKAAVWANRPRAEGLERAVAIKSDAAFAADEPPMLSEQGRGHRCSGDSVRSQKAVKNPGLADHHQKAEKNHSFDSPSKS
jgi:hypothetical protein